MGSTASSLNVIPADSPSIFDALATLQTSNPTAWMAIVRPNSPPVGLGGFLFDIPGDSDVHLKSAITRHFVESSTPIQDHIALEPEVVTVRGLVAELVMAVPTMPSQSPVPNALPLLPVMMPPATAGQTQAAATAAANQVLQQAALTSQQSLWQYFQATLPTIVSGSTANQQTTTGSTGPALTNNGKINRQSQVALYWQQAWWGRQLFSVETPWGIWTNMAIQDVRMMQSKESKYISDFTIIFERIRVAGDVTINTGNLAGRNADQQALLTNNGQTATTTPTAAQSTQIYNLFQDPSP